MKEEKILKLINRIQFIARTHFNLKNEEELEDASQAVLSFIITSKAIKAKDFKVPEFKIKYLIIDYIRSKNHHRRGPDCQLPEFVEFNSDHHDIDYDLEQRCIDRIDAQSLVKKITPKLTPRENDLFTELYLKNSNNVESAAALGLSPQYASQTHNLILEKLRGLA